VTDGSPYSERIRRRALDDVAPVLGWMVMEAALLELSLAEIWLDLRELRPDDKGRRHADTKQTIGVGLATRILESLDDRLTPGLRSGLTCLAEDSKELLKRRNRFVHDPWAYGVPTESRGFDPKLLQLSFDQDHQPPWTRANEPKWTAASTESVERLTEALRVARRFASGVYQRCQEEVGDLLDARAGGTQ
jgi:hypothetical protein